MRTTVAALYVRRDSVYKGMPGVDCWDADRDARLYLGPWPVVAHPPCGPWGRLHHRCRHQDRSLALRAVGQVRLWGGVLEHPAGSKVWRHCGLPKPGELPDPWGGFSVEIDQGRFGHRAPKSSWLYIVRAEVPPWPASGPPPAGRVERLSKRQREATPPPFAAWLVELARGAMASEAA